MKRFWSFLPMPVFLVALWLLLNDTVSPGHIVLGIALSLLLIWAGSALRPLRARPKRPLTALKLMCNVAADIIRSNIAVGRLIWLGRRAAMTPGFVKIPIELTDPHGLAALACIVTYTPGTVWAGFSQEESMLTLHVLDLKDESEWIRTIKERYEFPLKEIFE